MQEKENRTHSIFIRVSPTEKKEIEEKAKLANQSVANYLITLSQNQRTVVAKKIIGLLQQILNEVYNIDDHSFHSLENKIDRLTAAVEKLQNSP